MKKCFIIFLMLFVSIPLFPQVKRESILDKISFVDTVLYTKIPPVPRFCDNMPNLKKQKINVGDCNLYVEEEGSGIPIVLINGGPGGTHHYFHPWFSETAKYARVIYYDQRGCGLSDFYPGKEGYSVDQAVDDLEAIRNALKIDKWIVLGYSYGGFLAQHYTTKFPHSIAGLVLLGASPQIEYKDVDTRPGSFVTKEETARMKEARNQLNKLFKENKITEKELVQLGIYNNYINGYWKQQHFYKPDKKRIAQIALYEWVNDKNFNSLLNSSENRYDLAGAFEGNPIPTLILEGKWDLTWAESKKDAIKKNHPGSRMVIFENAAHGIYDEETDKFFAVLKEYILTLPKIDEGKLNTYSEYLKEREKKLAVAPSTIISQLNWGIASSKKLTESYTREWLKSITNLSEYLRTGFALYDMDNYKEALYVFEQMEIVFKDDAAKTALAVIWQGHMLDLLGDRVEAVKRYSKVSRMNLDAP